MPTGVYDRSKSKPRPRRAVEDRFWEKVDKSGDCWEWTGCRHKQGYGRFHVKTGEPPVFAHRLSYEMANGPIPDGMHVLHSCDNPSCVNPAHLSLGTHRQNMSESAERGRKHSSLRDNLSEVHAMREAGATQQSIADRFGVSQGAISMVLNGKRLEKFIWR